MSINWVTFIAQILNFFILVVLLYFVLFRKIIHVMDERQKRVEKQLDDAKLFRQKADQDQKDLDKEKEQMQLEKSSLLTQIQDDVAQQKITLIKQSQEEVDKKKKEWKSEIDSQKERFFQEMRKMAGESGLMISRKMMKDLAGVEGQELIEKAFIQKLQSFLETNNRVNLAGNVVISSAFPISKSFLHQIKDMLEKSRGTSIEIETHLAPELLLGIEITMTSGKIAWNVDNYLQQLQEKVDKSFSQFETKP
jgi:F-type H+-transporting ATPase subunit b